MDELKKNGTNPPNDTEPINGELTDELQKKLKELDKESNTVEYSGIFGKIIAAICIFIGLFVFLCSILGIYRFKYAMNRMHAAALGDTMGIFFVVLGLLILGQDIFHMAKYALIILFFWLSSPISTHLIAKVELLTNKDCEERMKDR